ncbi:MAG: ribonuclease HI family protein [Candidatus Shapirobacteria bacterium]
MELYVYTDGGARGNPGPAGFGVVVKDESEKVIYAHPKFLGITTNNQAEYEGLLHALSWVKSHLPPPSAVHFFSDSELMVRQLTGLYKVKSPLLLPLYTQARTIINDFSFPVYFHHVLRHLNKQADMLANQAMDSYVSK